MTEVPDKQTEGTGVGSRPWSRPGPWPRGEPSRSPRAAGPRSRDARAAGRRPVAAASRPTRDGGLVALPGERLSRAAGPLTEADLAQAEVFTLDDLEDAGAPSRSAAPTAIGRAEDGDEPRRRRRRGGRGRGRGRGRGEDGKPTTPTAPRRPSAVPPAPAAPRRSTAER